VPGRGAGNGNRRASRDFFYLARARRAQPPAPIRCISQVTQAPDSPRSVREAPAIPALELQVCPPSNGGAVRVRPRWHECSGVRPLSEASREQHFKGWHHLIDDVLVLRWHYALTCAALRPGTGPVSRAAALRQSVSPAAMISSRPASRRQRATGICRNRRPATPNTFSNELSCNPVMRVTF
jgi:hypothetical protein